jgi:uncharacterized protein YkwD
MVSALILVGSLAVSSGSAGRKKEDPREVVFRLTNEFRKSEKVALLTRNDKLDDAAQKHAENMARQDKYGDDGKNGHVLDGKNTPDRIAPVGYAWAGLSENVLRSSNTSNPGKSAVEVWQKSPGTRKSMLNEDFTEIGIGAAKSKSGKWYFCQVFAKPK